MKKLFTSVVGIVAFLILPLNLVAQAVSMGTAGWQIKAMEIRFSPTTISNVVEHTKGQVVKALDSSSTAEYDLAVKSMVRVVDSVSVEEFEGKMRDDVKGMLGRFSSFLTTMQSKFEGLVEEKELKLKQTSNAGEPKKVGGTIPGTNLGAILELKEELGFAEILNKNMDSLGKRLQAQTQRLSPANWHLAPTGIPELRPGPAPTK
ncbi:MAG: hypothetical protein WCP15_00910 [bacterium]